MTSKKLHRELTKLGITTLAAWVITTFAPIALMLIKGGLVSPSGSSVPRQTHVALLDLTHCLIYGVIPALTGGYLLVGLYILKYAKKAKEQDESKRVVS